MKNARDVVLRNEWRHAYKTLEGLVSIIIRRKKKQHLFSPTPVCGRV